MATSFTQVASSKHVLLTTFTKDGRPKPTTVWGARDGDRLLVYSGVEAWKVKRIRNTPRVTIASCGVRGKLKSGPVEAIARVLEDSETAPALRLILKRQGLIARLMNLAINSTRGREHNVAIEITPAKAANESASQGPRHA